MHSFFSLGVSLAEPRSTVADASLPFPLSGRCLSLLSLSLPPHAEGRESYEEVLTQLPQYRALVVVTAGRGTPTR